ncbi:4-hydroxy-tetrahydrodipicolinate synthase [Listeria welshimeri]|uniref:4-hydroxy-tetrahydrodipicolinate synthase n=1 Tax=Listeria welshimeri serovar 6b (strain ATCC 35897 / DSM 20650 / CCUG 15529 / CIP 8149 / NCTC 11857 / SLCC 5334 / V8) TaxID=386043 RepID=DAPA_LISW6|nr:4-hydroxy-tetrahydrodipicolinate synthase [Listeria welshimeri]A0AIN8.1 RecName: Full=4-hydroxy-tetrahydrodipicolinate synthase; Short=HTPA synthase [Listeria welshimeri serovar 6b str. SLCC5334]MBC1287636.1 4-hydroxy-tetrahydrodipicolinate synthase [Listeria welshimeri]MBC1354154.1 4-hydroxy-tetrahydrodipicolinate synthase [Listeria welshimeri]MBC1360026.1 4-hydroxy-tetrahydrodipicolinate synthase [Listeria welshimeri]MBC1369205.1 4-hydroxy-tetrahydrodipicolinate synthase [Listeria welshim
MDLGKVITAMVTPIHPEKDKVCKKRIHHLVNHLIANGSDGLVVAGTTGESPTLSHDEKIKLFRQVIETNAGRAKLIAGTGSNNTAETIAFTKEVAELGGIDAVLVVAPYYNKPNQDGLYAHFVAVAEASDLPVVIYNIPGRSVVNIEPETIIRLAKLPNIVGVKESSGNLDNISKIIAETPEDFLVYSGDDSLTLPILAVGGDGVISVASHVVGKEMQEMIQAFARGEVQKAASIHRSLLPIMNGLFAVPNPAPTKYLLNQQGISVGPVRLPLVDLNAEQGTKLQAILEGLSK